MFEVSRLSSMLPTQAQREPEGEQAQDPPDLERLTPEGAGQLQGFGGGGNAAVQELLGEPERFMSLTPLISTWLARGGEGEGLEGPGEGVGEGVQEEACSAELAEAAHKEALRQATEAIPGQDIIYEQLARQAAYGNAIAEQTLAEWGYEQVVVMPDEDETTGMYMVGFAPRTDLSSEEVVALEARHGRPLRAVLAFRGSLDAIDWLDDLNPESVGAFQFAAHEGDVQAALGRLAGVSPDGTVDTTGHSLGGALAQLAATAGPVSRVVTFQAPGIPASKVAEVDPDVEAHHHRAKNDFVAWAGEAHLDGESFLYDREGWDSMADAHTVHLLTAVNDLREDSDQHIAMGEGSTEHGKADEDKTRLDWVSQGGPDWFGSGEAGEAESAYAGGRQALFETGRKGLGYGLRGADEGLAGADGLSEAMVGLEQERQYLALGLKVLGGDAARMGFDAARVWAWGRESLYDGAASKGVANGAKGLLTPDGNDMEKELDPRDMPRYTRLWEEVKVAKGQGASEAEVKEMIRGSAIDETLRKRMEEQVERL